MNIEKRYWIKKEQNIEKIIILIEERFNKILLSKKEEIWNKIAWI